MAKSLHIISHSSETFSIKRSTIVIPGPDLSSPQELKVFTIANQLITLNKA